MKSHKNIRLSDSSTNKWILSVFENVPNRRRKIKDNFDHKHNKIVNFFFFLGF